MQAIAFFLLYNGIGDSMDKIKEIKLYDYNGMYFGYDFDIDITEDIIKHCIYYEKFEKYEYSNKKYKTQLWNEIIDQIDAIFELHKECPEIKFELDDVVLDEGKSGYEITFEKDKQTYTKKYFFVNDRRFTTVRELLLEACTNKGKKIKKYGPPYPIGIYFYIGTYIDKNYFSFQSNPIDLIEGNKRYLNIHWNENGEAKSISITTKDEPWNRIYPLVKSYEPHKLKVVARDNEYAVTLYYNDGQQITFKPNLDELKTLEKEAKAIQLSYLDK